ncbi:hypothetical protein BJ138DRAFT_721920 [Hygrophoropsis aurantiaca]|uniref:Uncharacterized protein n=1 Tax=Hygrophoropsis aurantiaca TaxID=72124 RepID=A0ACB8AJD5_9AGAM|nr:hypothetical protein BJ138DRAFT_721920 [Hygrophoropsis aurantiaca]
MFASSFVAALALASSAFANVYITSPVAGSIFTAGQQSTISWQDNGQAPTLAQFGLASFGIYVGNSIEQTLLQTISASVNVSSNSSLTFTPTATIGPDSDQYFIRVQSLSYMNPAEPQYPEEAFSARFNMTGMTGNFSATAQQEINGQSTAPIGGSTSAGSTASMSYGMTVTSVVSAPAASSPAATTSASTSSAGSSMREVAGAGIVGAVLLACCSLLL